MNSSADANSSSTIRLSEAQFGSRQLRLTTGKTYKIVAGDGKGSIYVRCMDWAAKALLANMSYTIKDVKGKDLTGTTNRDGVLRHDDIPAGYYSLEAQDQRATVFTVEKPQEPDIVRLVLHDPEDSGSPEARQLGPDEDV